VLGGGAYQKRPSLLATNVQPEIRPSGLGESRVVCTELASKIAKERLAPALRVFAFCNFARSRFGGAGIFLIRARFD
jgi:hypothetical protein